MESTLVIIPLVALFLITLELIVAVNYRNIDTSFAQSDASTRAITASPGANDEVLTLSPGRTGETLQLVVVRRRRTLPSFISRLPMISGIRRHSTETVGVAVVEREP
ncbi:MAG: hypothetical protein HY050_02710 [Actinobacteria bacterium]|nr:hypothetical protein [Actinomycetota bacterium]